MSAAQVAPEVAAAPDVAAWLRTALTVLFVVALPLLIISTNLRLMVTDRDFLLAGFRDNRVDLVTGISQPELGQVADAFVAYFQAPPGRMDVQVTISGQRRPLFNDRELSHMEDVQALIQAFFRLQIFAAVVVAARLVVALAVERSAVSLGRDMLVSSLLTVALVLVVGALSLVDFTDLWTRFHQIAFRNNLWLLDPRTDYLIMLFPEPFWFTGTLRMAIGTAVPTLLIGIVGFLAWRFGPRPG